MARFERYNAQKTLNYSHVLRQIYAMKIPTPRRRGDGWRIEVCVKGTRDSATLDTQAEAREWAARRILELKDAAQRAASGEMPRHTLAELLLRYLSDVSQHKKGGKIEADRIKAFIRDNPKLALSYLPDITPQQLTAWRNYRATQVAPSTVRRDINLLSSAMTYAVKELYWLHENPFTRVVRPKNAKARDRRVDPGETERVLAELGHVPGQPPADVRQRVAWVFLFALGTGMRTSEITSMRWSNVHRAYVRIPDSKNGHGRDVPMSDDVAALIECARGLDDDWVMPVSADSVKNVFRRACQRAGVQGLWFRDSRHEASTQLAKILENPMDLAKMTGHKDLKTLLNVYYNPTGDELAEKLRAKK